MVENMHDVPYSLSLGPEVVACMTAVCSGVRSVCPSLPLGVQILSSANQQALAVALASGSLLDASRNGFIPLPGQRCLFGWSQVWISSGPRVSSSLMWQTRVSWMPVLGIY